MSRFARLRKIEKRIPSPEERVTRVTWTFVNPTDYPSGGAPIGPGSESDTRPESMKPKPGEPVEWEFIMGSPPVKALLPPG